MNVLRTWLSAAFLLPLVGAAVDDRFALTYLHVDGRRQDHVIADFNGDGLSDIVMTSINYDHAPPIRWFTLYTQNPRGKFRDAPDQSWPIDNRAACVLFGNFTRKNARDPCFVAADGIYYYPWIDAEKTFATTPRKLLHTGTFFVAPSSQSLPMLHAPVDLDGNGLDDIILPVTGGYKVYMQTKSGIFGIVSPIELPGESAAERKEIESAQFVTTRSHPRIDFEDVNGDGRLDLINLQGMLIRYFIQRSDGTFAKTPSLRFNLRDLKDPTEKDKVTIAFVDFTDINGDKKSDLMITKVVGTVGMFKSMRTEVMIYLGNGTGRFFRLDAKINLDGVSIVDPVLADINLDGRKDLFLSSIRADLLDVGKSMLVKAVDIKYYLYVFDGTIDNYPAGGPAWTSSTTIEIRDIEKSGIDSMPLVYIGGDHTGDRRPDLIKLNPNKTLEIYPGEERRAMSTMYADFSRGVAFGAELPRLPKSIRFGDVNGDGIDDVILAHNSAVGLLLSSKR